MTEDKILVDTQKGEQPAHVPEIKERGWIEPYFPEQVPPVPTTVSTVASVASVQDASGEKIESDGLTAKSDKKPKALSETEIEAFFARMRALKNGGETPHALEGEGGNISGAGNRFDDVLSPPVRSEEEQGAWINNLLSQSSLHPGSGQPGSWVDQILNDGGANHGSESLNDHGHDGHGSDDVSGHSR